MPRYASRAYSIMAVLPDDIIKSVAYDARISSYSALEKKIPLSRWPFLRRHGKEIIEILINVDARYDFGKSAKAATKVARELAKAAKAVPRKSCWETDGRAPVLDILESDDDDRELERWDCK